MIAILRISSIRVVIYLDDLLLLPPGPSRAPENLQDCNHPFHRFRVRHQTREVLTLTHANNHLSGCTAELARPYDSCSSEETLPHTIGVQRDPDQRVVLHAGTLGTAGSDESDCTDWDLGSTIALPSSSTNVHCSPAQERSLHTIKAVPDSPNEGSILRTQIVVFKETESNQPDDVEPPGNRRNNIDGRLQERLGGKLSGPKDGGSVAEGRGRTSNPDPGSIATNAFLQHWRQWKVFIHAPIVLLPRILQKLRQDQATGLVIAPTWPGQPWFPTLQELLVDFPAQLPIAEGTIFLPFDQQAIHSMWKTLRLAVWPLSGLVCKQQAFHQRCAKLCWPPGEQVLRRDTKDPGSNGLAGVCKGINVPFQHL